MKIYEADRQQVRSSTNMQSGFTIQANAQAFEILSGALYQHKAAAIVRELVSNAYDSHVEAGKSHVPFTVVLPTSLNPIFEVEDYGVGLDDVEVREVYTSLFTSTKRDTNEQIGAFGLGAKTPIAYTESFTIVARKNGIERVYMAYKDGEGMPCINLLEQRKTDKSNGLKVSVPVKEQDIEEFRHEAQFILGFFVPLPNVNLEGFEAITQDVGKQLQTQDIVAVGSLRRRSRSMLYNEEVYAVMGNVCYPIPRSLILSQEVEELFSSEQLSTIRSFLEVFTYSVDCCFIKFEIGELDVAASRETLSLTERTRKTTIKTIGDKILTYIKEIQDELNNKRSGFEVMQRLRSRFGSVRMIHHLAKTIRTRDGMLLSDFLNKIILPKQKYTLYLSESWNRRRAGKYKDVRVEQVINSSEVIIVYRKPKDVAVGVDLFCKELISEDKKSMLIYLTTNKSLQAVKKYFSKFNGVDFTFFNYAEERAKILEKRRKNRNANRGTSPNASHTRTALPDTEIKAQYFNYDITSLVPITAMPTKVIDVSNDNVRSKYYYVDAEDYEHYIEYGIERGNTTTYYNGPETEVSRNILKEIPKIRVMKLTRMSERKIKDNDIPHLSEFFKQQLPIFLKIYEHEKSRAEVIDDSYSLDILYSTSELLMGLEGIGDDIINYLNDNGYDIKLSAKDLAYYGSFTSGHRTYRIKNWFSTIFTLAGMEESEVNEKLKQLDANKYHRKNIVGEIINYCRERYSIITNYIQDNYVLYNMIKDGAFFKLATLLDKDGDKENE